ncbi:hypothetical protein QLS71_009490 [Mariniflexile litorale]|uniref:Uncharacterized protein n=1 Tax=Mariniflexile litorale TaxID=3045158 RepID=A0AAU7EAZ3_9FLAO|nr:hypothetical protein [Mariniflexile sp. KMM 9835]MDQ8210552.1 hypothetical protein [Mariniflexile sp. KMM 9835]
MKNLISNMTSKVLTLLCFIVFFISSVTSVFAQGEVYWQPPSSGNYDDWTITFIGTDQYGDPYDAYVFNVDSDDADEGELYGIAEGTYDVHIEGPTYWGHSFEITYDSGGYSSNWYYFHNTEYTIENFIVDDTGGSSIWIDLVH